MEIAGLDKNLETLTYFQYLNLQWKRRYYEPGSFSMRILAADYDPRVKFLYTPDRPEVAWWKRWTTSARRRASLCS